MIKSSSFKKAKFVKTALAFKDYPLFYGGKGGGTLPEVAVAGRSNVGKSSLINHLFGEKKLAKTSSTPGKTQALNFFNIDDLLIFVDLPGYGYAQVPLEVKKKWGPMVQTYLQKRESLSLVLFLFDIRRTPNHEDIQFLEWAISAQKSIILILTKVDKLTLNQRNVATKRIMEAFGAENLHHLYYSVPDNKGRGELVGLLKEWYADVLKSKKEDDDGTSG